APRTRSQCSAFSNGSRNKGLIDCIAQRHTHTHPYVVLAMDRFAPLEELKRQWTDQYVLVNADRAELKRFANIVGRVVTVNYNGKAVVDLQDGGWYDITASADCLRILDPAEEKAKYKNVNSAQPIPEKQGA